MSFRDVASDDDLITEINVTPFVDVVLVLLILFMMTAPAAYQSSVKVQLPKSVTSENVDHITLKFIVDDKGDVFIDGKKVSNKSIESTVKKALKYDKKADAILLADRRVSHGLVLTVIDAVRNAGLHQIAIGTQEQ